MVEVIGSQQRSTTTPLPLPPLSLSLGTKHKVTRVDVALQGWSLDEYASGTLALNVVLSLNIYPARGGPCHFTIKRKYQVSVPRDFRDIRQIGRASWRERV